MRKFLIVFVAVILTFSLSLSAEGLSGKSCSWYVMRNKQQQPICEKQFEFIENYNGYFVDKNATEDDKVIYLTFDAGYVNENVESIVNTLKNHNAQGAFFMLEYPIKNNTDLVKKIIDNGNLICNHTACHKDMTRYCSEAEFMADIRRLEDDYREYIGGEIAHFYRPPEGRFSEQNLSFAEKNGYKTVFWSFAYADWDNNDQPDEENAVNLIMENTHNGMIILLHPTSKTNAEIMDKLLTNWEERGYRFGSLNELD